MSDFDFSMILVGIIFRDFRVGFDKMKHHRAQIATKSLEVLRRYYYATRALATNPTGMCYAGATSCLLRGKCYETGNAPRTHSSPAPSRGYATLLRASIESMDRSKMYVGTYLRVFILPTYTKWQF